MGRRAVTGEAKRIFDEKRKNRYDEKAGEDSKDPLVNLEGSAKDVKGKEDT